MSARCDECGAPRPDGQRPCPSCGTPAPAAPPVRTWDAPEALAGWTLLQRATVAYAVAQLGLVAFGGPRAALRLAMLVPFVGLPLWLARTRNGVWLRRWAVFLGVATVTTLGLMLVGQIPTGPAQAATAACSLAWSAATARAAWRVHRGFVDRPGGMTSPRDSL